jgi:hypothetical protein
MTSLPHSPRRWARARQLVGVLSPTVQADSNVLAMLLAIIDSPVACVYRARCAIAILFLLNPEIKDRKRSLVQGTGL